MIVLLASSNFEHFQWAVCPFVGEDPKHQLHTQGMDSPGKDKAVVKLVVQHDCKICGRWAQVVYMPWYRQIDPLWTRSGLPQTNSGPALDLPQPAPDPLRTMTWSIPPGHHKGVALHCLYPIYVKAQCTLSELGFPKVPVGKAKCLGWGLSGRPGRDAFIEVAGIFAPTLKFDNWTRSCQPVCQWCCQ